MGARQLQSCRVLRVIYPKTVGATISVPSGPANSDARRARGHERLDAGTYLLLGVRGRELHANARLALRHDGVAERRHEYALPLHLGGSPLREHGVAEHHGNDRVLSRQQIEPFSSHERPE